MADVVTEQNIMLPDGYTMRAATMDDVPAVVDLINAVYMGLIGEPDTNIEALTHSWQRPKFDLSVGTCLVIAPDGGFAGFADFWNLNAPYVRYFGWSGVHPDHDDPAVAEALLRWLANSAQASVVKAPPEARVVLHMDAMPQALTIRRTAERLGFKHIRSFYEMRIEMDAPPPVPVLPEGITMRAMVRGEEADIVRAMRAGFADHWGYVEMPFEQEYEKWMHHIESFPDFDPSLWMLAMAGDEIAGICLCDPKTDFDEHLAWCDKLAVVPKHRKQGLGLAMLQHAFGVFWERGTTRVGLGVDADSLTGALRLYEKAGMSQAFEFMNYELELRDGIDMMKQSVEE